MKVGTDMKDWWGVHIAAGFPGEENLSDSAEEDEKEEARARKSGK